MRTIVRNLPYPQCSFYANSRSGHDFGKALYFAPRMRRFSLRRIKARAGNSCAFAKYESRTKFEHKRVAPK
jgi:hypothetical protein